MSTEPMFMVKIRAPGDKVFHFITPSATLTRLRIHAVMMTRARADQYAAQLAASNPGADLRVIPAFPAK
jgi:hypothetical protein